MIFFQGSRNRRGTPASSVTQATVTTTPPAPAPRSISTQHPGSSTTTTSRPDITTERSSSFMCGEARKSLGKYIDSDNFSVASTSAVAGTRRPRAPTDASLKRPPSAHNTAAATAAGGGFLASIWTLGTHFAQGTKEVVNDFAAVTAGFKRERPVAYVVGDDGVTSGTETDASGLTDDASASETGSDESEVELSEEEEIEQRSVSDAKILVTKGKRVEEEGELTPRQERADPVPESSGSRGESFEIIRKHSETTEGVAAEVLFDADEPENKKVSQEEEGPEGYVEEHFGAEPVLVTAVVEEIAPKKPLSVVESEPEVKLEEPVKEEVSPAEIPIPASPLLIPTPASPLLTPLTPEPRVGSPSTVEIAIQVSPTVEIAVQTDFDDVPEVPARSEARNKSPVQGLGVEGADLEAEPVLVEKPVPVHRKSMIEEVEELEAKRIGKRPVRVSSPKIPSANVSPITVDSEFENHDVISKIPHAGPSNSRNIPTSRRLPPIPTDLKLPSDAISPPTSPVKEGAPSRRPSISGAGSRLSWLGSPKDQEIKFDADGNAIEPELKRRLSRRLSISGAVKKVREMQLSTPNEDVAAEALELKFDADGKPIDPGPSSPASTTMKKRRMSFMDAVKIAQEAASPKKEKEHAIDDHGLEISPKQQRNRRMSFIDAVKKATSPKLEHAGPVDEPAGGLELKFDADGKPIDPGPTGDYASPATKMKRRMSIRDVVKKATSPKHEHKPSVEETDLEFDANGKPIDPGPSTIEATPATKMKRRMSIREAVNKVREEIAPKHHDAPILELKLDADGKPIDPGPDPFTSPIRTRRLSILGRLPRHLDVTADPAVPPSPTIDHTVDEKSSFKSKPKLFKAPTFSFGTPKSAVTNDNASSIADSEKKPALFRRATLGLGVRHSPKPSVDSTHGANGSQISVASSAMPPPTTPTKGHERRKSGMFRLGSIARKKTDSSIPTPSIPTPEAAASRLSFSSAVGSPIRPTTSSGPGGDDAISIAESVASKRSSIKRPFFRRGTMSNGSRPGTGSLGNIRPGTSNGDEPKPGLFRRSTTTEAVKESAVEEVDEAVEKAGKRLSRAATFMRRRTSELPKNTAV